MNGEGAVGALLDHEDPVVIGGEAVGLDLHGNHGSGRYHRRDVVGRGVVGVVNHAQGVGLGGEEVAAQA
jgi:hypothetical protein